jgi:uncharacterized damage-inducible protein DinB
MESLKEIFELQTRLLNNVLSGIEENNAAVRLGGNTNHIAWLTGHIVSSRHAIVNLIGGTMDYQYDDLFGQGKGLEDTQYPSLHDLKSAWDTCSISLMGQLGQLERTALEEEAPIKVPLGNGSMRSLIAFFAHHEAYHIGQLGILRKYFGAEAMKYN